MKKANERDIKPSSLEGTKGVDFRPMVADNMAAPNFYLRVFDVEPGGHTPLHRHPWEHEIYVVSGEGRIVLEEGGEKLSAGDALLVEPGELHQFVNDGGAILKLVCVIPKPKEA
jgi:quercetin dioxygenase-like cupin family protein